MDIIVKVLASRWLSVWSCLKRSYRRQSGHCSQLDWASSRM